ncbi:hypothetical protein [Mesorhizobium sp. B2-8-9]|uniref:hypothetical protein n=1 Tax=Mesorhizobium sp. B2-8-9 TaxID=2589899 RepID=UPI0011281535|nr:hypothetical protein [Mesorhizobium sp. B2-8-9]TPI83484.1 hypothetical protein FJ423_07575 [Mesorhizobium sp. B2-8-9]
MTEKRGRGRPEGTGKKDGPFLADMADLMIRTPKMRKTTAIRRVMAARSDWEAASPEAMVHRLQEKWKAEGEAHLAAAHKRATAWTATPRSSHLNYVGIPDGLQRHLGVMSPLTSSVLDQAAADARRALDAVRGDFGKYGALWQAIQGDLAKYGARFDGVRDHAATTFREFEEARRRAFAPGQGILDEMASLRKQAEAQLAAVRGPFAELEKSFAQFASGASVNSPAVRTALGLA